MAKKTKSSASREGRLVIHNTRSVHFRHIHFDGAEASITPNDYINVSFYSERYNIPNVLHFSTDDKQDLIESYNTDVNKPINENDINIAREYEVSLFMNKQGLEDLIEILKEAKDALDEDADASSEQ